MVAFSMGWLPLSCSKTSPAQSHVSSTKQVAAKLANEKNLGQLALTNHIETCVNLGAGNSCTITPTLLDHKNLQLVMALESRKKDGKTAGLSVVQVVAHTGQSFDITVGDLDITLTPELAA
ncbi:MAG: hypothetical protein ACREC8_04320, partial [Limisphaerales bacterium]